MKHTPVLLHEVVDALELQTNDIVLDGTVGAGGHARAITQQLGENGMFIGLDMDIEALKTAADTLKDARCRLRLRKSNYRHLDAILKEEGVTAVDKVLLDLGLSSMQLERSGRGFSFQTDEPLLMTFSDESSSHMFTAKGIVNEWEEQNIADIIFGYGDERYARRIAKEIVKRRADEPITTTGKLVEVIKAATPRRYHRGSIHPATRTFQALRMVVNDEIEGLKETLQKAHDHLSSGGIIAVISFHSTEDRVVKQMFKQWGNEQFGSVQTKKPISPSDEELDDNPRARSAKLRVYKKH